MATAKSAFIAECEKVKRSKNFQGVAKIALENLGVEHKRNINWDKFEEGARSLTGQLGAACGKKTSKR